jgi:hypothetical protein
MDLPKLNSFSTDNNMNILGKEYEPDVQKPLYDYYEFTKLRGVASDKYLNEDILSKLTILTHSLDEKLLQLKRKKKKFPSDGTFRDTEQKATLPSSKSESSIATAAWKKKAAQLNKGQVNKSINIILNSLTDSNIPSVLSRLQKTITVTDTESIDVLIECLISSSMLQPLYVYNYAVLCKELDKYFEGSNLSEVVVQKMIENYFPQIHGNSIQKPQYRCLSLFYTSLYIIGIVSAEQYLKFLDSNLSYFENPNEILKDYSMDAIIQSINHIIKKNIPEKINEIRPFVEKLKLIWEDAKTPVRLKFQLYDIRDYYVK